jgi:hypothetical protein
MNRQEDDDNFLTKQTVLVIWYTDKKKGMGTVLNTQKSFTNYVTDALIYYSAER